MPDTAFYLHVKTIHHTSIALSLLLFTARWLGVLARAHWPMKRPVRIASVAIDTVLLTGAMMLLTILPWAMFGNGWLGTKLVLLVVYVVLGSLALKRGRNLRVRAWCYGAAVLVYLAIIGIARAHDPLGWLRYWLG